MAGQGADRFAGAMNTQQRDGDIPLVVGGTGKTGRRVAERLVTGSRRVHIGSPSSRLGFDWNDGTTWEPALGGVGAAYLTYAPDLGLPGAADRVRTSPPRHSARVCAGWCCSPDAGSTATHRPSEPCRTPVWRRRTA